MTTLKIGTETENESVKAAADTSGYAQSALLYFREQIFILSVKEEERDYMKKTGFIIMTAILLMSAGCAPPDVTGIRGSVTGITSGENSIVILVEGSIEED
jgi:hypothetical protein